MALRKDTKSLPSLKNHTWLSSRILLHTLCPRTEETPPGRKKFACGQNTSHATQKARSEETLQENTEDKTAIANENKMTTYLVSRTRVLVCLSKKTGSGSAPRYKMASLSFSASRNKGTHAVFASLMADKERLKMLLVKQAHFRVCRQSSAPYRHTMAKKGGNTMRV